MKESLRAKLDQLAARLDELTALLGSPEATSDMDRYRALTKEHADIGPVVERFLDTPAAGKSRMISSGRPAGLTPWRIARTQSTSV